MSAHNRSRLGDSGRRAFQNPGINDAGYNTRVDIRFTARSLPLPAQICASQFVHSPFGFVLPAFPVAP